MSNLKRWIETEADGEPIEAVVIGNMGWPDYKLDELPKASRDKTKWGIPLAWADAAPLLDYEFNSGFGAPGCQAITAWTATKVLFVSQYDGATGLASVPRHPIAHEPIMPGG